MKIPLLKFLDASFGRLVTAVWSSSETRTEVPLDPKNALFVRPGGIGDAALVVPALREFKEKFPDCEVDILAERRNEKVFLLWDGLRDVFCYDRIADLLCVRRRTYDVVIDTEQWHRLSAVFARLFGGKCLVGFGSNDRKKLLAQSIPYDHNRYELFSFYSLLSPWRTPPSVLPESPFLKLPNGAEKIVDQLLGHAAGKHFVTIFPGGSRPEKSWGTEKFCGLVKMLAENGLSYIVLGGSADRLVANRLASAAGGISLAGQTSLVESAAVLSKSRLLIANDSGLLHIAVGLGVPTVGIFGPSNPEKWGAKGPKDSTVASFAECSPCSSYGFMPKCDKGLVCFNEITVDMVFDQVRRLNQELDC